MALRLRLRTYINLKKFLDDKINDKINNKINDKINDLDLEILDNLKKYLTINEIAVLTEYSGLIAPPNPVF